MKAQFVFENFKRHKDNPLKSLDIGHNSSNMNEEYYKIIQDLKTFDENNDIENLNKLIKEIALKLGRNPKFLEEPNFKFLFNKKLLSYLKIKLAEFSKTEEEEIRDENYNLYVFLGYNKFVELKNDNFKKIFTFENLVYIDRYNSADLSQIQFMRMRVRTYDMQSNADLYGVNIPKNMLKGNRNYYPEEIDKNVLKYIKENKFKI